MESRVRREVQARFGGECSETCRSDAVRRWALSLHRKHGQFEWTGPAILFVCLIFVLLAPNYIWGIVGL